MATRNRSGSLFLKSRTQTTRFNHGLGSVFLSASLNFSVAFYCDTVYWAFLLVLQTRPPAMNLLCYPAVVCSRFRSILTPNHILCRAQERHPYTQLFQEEPCDMREITLDKTYRSHLTHHLFLFLPVSKTVDAVSSAQRLALTSDLLNRKGHADISQTRPLVVL
jgi:hypothetical protein